jgi:ubiquinone/menaquinone biosynthesis C-methylase UbiE
MEQKRRPLQGVLNILSFNRYFYFYGLIVLFALITALWFFAWSGLIFSLAVALFLYGLIMPLLVSAYVYDFSGYYRLDWLKNVIDYKQQAKLIVNINAGFDETSFIIKEKFPIADMRVFDFYNARQHTEPAIKRARKVSVVYPNTQSIDSGRIPLDDHSVDVLFLLSAAHEIRSQQEKVRFLKECYRVCKTDAKVVMVEHLRDFPNFLAFTIGFTHFFSAGTWRKSFQRAGFTSFEERKFTPFMSIFTCGR